VGHVLAHHLPAGLLYHVAAGRAACAQCKTSSKGKDCIHSRKEKKEKKRKDFAFRRQFAFT